MNGAAPGFVSSRDPWATGGLRSMEGFNFDLQLRRLSPEGMGITVAGGIVESLCWKVIRFIRFIRCDMISMMLTVI